MRLSKTGCASMFIRAQAANCENEPQLLPCRTCGIGSKHSGIESRPVDPVRCVRCSNRAMRLIGKLLCPSCSNRQAEFIAGKNARGALPVHFVPLHIFDYDDSLIIVARNAKEAGSVVTRMRGYIDPDALVDYGLATPFEVDDWWDEIKKWSSQSRGQRARFVL